MHTPARRRARRSGLALTPVVAVVSVIAMALGLINVHTADPRTTPVRIGPAVTITPFVEGQPVPPGFVGLSLEYPALTAYAGTDPDSLNPVFERLVGNLSPGHAPVLRIGGDSADGTWWPVPAMKKPPGVTYALTDDWLAVAGALTRKLHARVLLGLNFEADQPALAAAEAHALSSAIGSRPLLGFELGNEPELYGTFPWYRTSSDEGVPGRPRGYGFAAFQADYRTFAGELGDVPLAGPATGGPGWNRYLGRFLAAEPTVRMVTVHRYPLQVCFTPVTSSRYPTVAHLLAREATTGLGTSFASAVAVAHRHGLPLRVDELNTVSCGADPSISQSGASALWALETLFELARAGVDGVNLHTFPGAGYGLFSFADHDGRWRGSVAPEYYGLLVFAQAAPPGARLLHISGDRSATVRVWATKARDGTIGIVVVNQDLGHPVSVALAVADHRGTATAETLRLPESSFGQESPAGDRGTSSVVDPVTLGGQRIAAGSATGRLTGPRKVSTLMPSSGRYRLVLPAASAALVTIGGGRLTRR